MPGQTEILAICWFALLANSFVRLALNISARIEQRVSSSKPLLRCQPGAARWKCPVLK